MNMKILQYQVNICFINLYHLSAFSFQLTFHDIYEVLHANFDNQLQNIRILYYTAGQKLSVLPVEPKLGKMLILGAIFNCLNPIMTVVAGLSVRDPFLMPFDRRDVSSLPSNAFDGTSYYLHSTMCHFDFWHVHKGVYKSYLHKLYVYIHL